MGEAKRRKEQGLAPKDPKRKGSKADKQNIFANYRILLYVFVGLFIAYLFYDLINYYVL